MQKVLALVIPAVLAAPLLYVGYLLHFGTTDTYWNFVFEHYLVFFGLPYAAVLALYLVLVLESTRGPIEFEGLTLKFKGAAGPIILWVIVFLSIVVSIKLLWNA
ncbi:MAG: hypothetical protein U9Q81_01540 [Pseudomonadota bacterium]|nr:hypothetical protein [Pseudomonadota bacterium]